MAQPVPHQELLARLRALAARERRSLDQEALVLLEGEVAACETAEERARHQIEAWRGLAGGWESERTFDEEVAELYAARTPGRDARTR